VIRLVPTTDLLHLLTPDADEYGTDGLDVADVLPHVRRAEGYPQLLAEVRERGIDVPVLVRERHGALWLEDGHHRIAAAVDCGLGVVPTTDIELHTI
jgi:ParB-like chromosome segregation protein Spo0J